MVLRPDEEAEQERVQRDERIRSNVKKVGAGAVAVGGSLLSSQIAPFLSPYIPMDLAMKGINKVSPRLGQFLKKGEKMGLDLQEGLNFIKDKINSPAEEESKSPSKSPEENRNIVQKYSPELHEYLSQKVKAGMRPGVIALSLLKGQGAKNFKDVIGKIVKDYKTDWISLVEALYGGANKEGSQSQAALQQEQPQQQMQQPAQQQMQQQSPQRGGQKEKFIDMLTKLSQQLEPRQ